ncbi:hypothetical protein Zm00014a_026540 [Zea mays]|uniref:Uncharacterized protein n=1 Tax=Zea mays TaxID=4577 RepID=A0A3L6DMY3_MAIZE|nr:hypothetical protein Zm00014a_026540 [Zea mays]
MADGSLEWLSPRSSTSANTTSPGNRSLGHKSLSAPPLIRLLHICGTTHGGYCCSDLLLIDDVGAGVPHRSEDVAWVTIRVASTPAAAPLGPCDIRLLCHGLPDADEGEDGDVRGRLAGAQPVGVARLPAARRRAAVAGVARLRGPFVHLQVPGVPGDGILLPRAVPGGHRRGPGEAGADAGQHLRERRVMARRRRALLQLRPLVDAHRLDAGVELELHTPIRGNPLRWDYMGESGRYYEDMDRTVAFQRGARSTEHWQ